jgi:hypothetical protein
VASDCNGLQLLSGFFFYFMQQRALAKMSETLPLNAVELFLALFPHCRAEDFFA